MVIGLFIAKLVAVLFFLVDDVRRGIQWVVSKIFVPISDGSIPCGEGISRSAFMSWLGLAAGTTLFGTLLYGFSNKYNYNVKKLQLAFDNLPNAFKGLKIVGAHHGVVHGIHGAAVRGLLLIEGGLVLLHPSVVLCPALVGLLLFIGVVLCPALLRGSVVGCDLLWVVLGVREAVYERLFRLFEGRLFRSQHL